MLPNCIEKYLFHIQYCDSFSGLAIIKLFLEVWFFTEIICLKCQNLQKYRNWWEPKSFLLQVSSPLQSRCPIIDNISVSYNLVEHHPLKLLKEGTGTSSLAGTGDETRNLAQKIQRGRTGCQTQFWTKTQGQMSLVPEFVPVDTIFCDWKLHSLENFRFSHSQQSELAYMHLSITFFF